ncbi:MAG: hypothetical protein ABEI31_05535 [Halodesulfurarchaeum sp.]
MEEVLSGKRPDFGEIRVFLGSVWVEEDPGETTGRQDRGGEVAVRKRGRGQFEEGDRFKEGEVSSRRETSSRRGVDRSKTVLSVHSGWTVSPWGGGRHAVQDVLLLPVSVTDRPLNNPCRIEGNRGESG